MLGLVTAKGFFPSIPQKKPTTTKLKNTPSNGENNKRNRNNQTPVGAHGYDQS
jgi:hypothetical protein